MILKFYWKKIQDREKEGIRRKFSIVRINFLREKWEMEGSESIKIIEVMNVLTHE